MSIAGPKISRWTIAVCLAISLPLALTGCGKRPRSVDAPEGSHEVYPKHYPPPDSPDTHL